jgi:hypothetical protein
MAISFDNLGSVLNRAARSARQAQVFEPDFQEEKKEETKSKKKKRKHYTAAFAPLFYRGSLGTPKTPGSYSGNDGDHDADDAPAAGGASPSGSGAGAGGAGAGPGGGAMGSSWVPPSKVRVIHEMRRSLGLLEFSGGSGAGAVAWTGFAVPNPLSVNIRQGGPTIGGPGFSNNSDGQPQGGIYDPAKSPGLGFRSEGAWRVWKAALEIMSKDKTIPTGAILQAAFQRAAVKMPQMDPAEVRLLEMGIQWYMSDPVPFAAKRDGGSGAIGTPAPVGGGS